MFSKLSLVPLLAAAFSLTACGQIQLPTSLSQLPRLPNAPQALVSPTPTPAPDASTNAPAPNSGSQSNRNQGNRPQAVAALLQAFHQLGWEAGVVTKTSSDQIDLRTVKNGPDKIAIGARTIVIVPGNSSATISDIRMGDRIIADVPNNQTTASLIMGVPKDYDKDNVQLGLVQSNSNGSVSLQTRGGSDTLTTSANTQVIKVLRGGVALGNVSDLQSGNLVLAIGHVGKAEFVTQVVFSLPKDALALGKVLGGDKKAPAQTPVPKPGN